MSLFVNVENEELGQMFDRSHQTFEINLRSSTTANLDDATMLHCKKELERPPNHSETPSKSKRKISLKQLQPYPKMFSSKLELDQPPLVCTQNSESLGDFIGWFRALGLPVNICSDVSDLHHHLNYADCPLSLIVIDVDGVADIEVTFCRILNLRQEYPEIPIILISKYISFSDSANDYFAMADVFLDHSQLSFDIEDYVAIAMSNNKRWSNRTRHQQKRVGLS